MVRLEKQQNEVQRLVDECRQGVLTTMLFGYSFNSLIQFLRAVNDIWR